MGLGSNSELCLLRFGLYSRHSISIFDVLKHNAIRNQGIRNILHVRVDAFILKAGVPCKIKADAKSTVRAKEAAQRSRKLSPVIYH